MRYAFIRTQEAHHAVTRLCRALAVSRSGYYAWRDRPPSVRATENQQLLLALRTLHHEMREQYGAIKLWREATGRGLQCGRHRVARLRKQGGLEAPTGAALPRHRRTPSVAAAGPQRAVRTADN